MEQQILPDYIGSSPDLWKVVYRVHATKRMFERRITEADIKQLLEIGTIIETYEEDYPFPSVLVGSKSTDNRRLHCVVGIDADLHYLYIITIYEPDPEKWTDDYTKRRTS